MTYVAAQAIPIIKRGSNRSATHRSLLSPSADRTRVDKLAQDLPATNARKRERVARELASDAARSNRAVAEAVGVGNRFVGEVRREMEIGIGSQFPRVHVYLNTKAGRRRKDGSAAAAQHSTECWCGEGDVEPPAPSEADRVKTALRELSERGETYRWTADSSQQLADDVEAICGLVRNPKTLQQQSMKLGLPLIKDRKGKANTAFIEFDRFFRYDAISVTAQLAVGRCPTGSSWGCGLGLRVATPGAVVAERPSSGLLSSVASSAA